MMKKYFSGNQKGFTLVEVLIAVIIFSIAVVGVITATVQSGMSINDAKYRTEARYLAQEEIEIIRALRDSYVLHHHSTDGDDAGWCDFLSKLPGAGGADCHASSAFFSSPFDIDAASAFADTSNISSSSSTFSSFLSIGGLTDCASDSTACDLLYDSTTGYYNHGTGVKSPFNRTVSMVSSGPDRELEMTVTVRWQEGASTQSLALNESIFNWYAYH